MSADNAIAERVISAIYAAGVHRAVINEVWPECHRAKCQHRHPTPDEAFSMMKHQIAEMIKLELGYRRVSRPEFDGSDYTATEQAEITLGVLMDTYFTKSGRFIRAAEMILEAYPEMVAVLTDTPDLEGLGA